MSEGEALKRTKEGSDGDGGKYDPTSTSRASEIGASFNCRIAGIATADFRSNSLLLGCCCCCCEDATIPLVLALVEAEHFGETGKSLDVGTRDAVAIFLVGIQSFCTVLLCEKKLLFERLKVFRFWCHLDKATWKTKRSLWSTQPF